MIGRNAGSWTVPTLRDAPNIELVVGEPLEPSTLQLGPLSKQFCGGPSGSIDPVDVNCTSTVTGAGAPGDATASAPIPANANPATPVPTYWRADIRGARLRCSDKV